MTLGFTACEVTYTRRARGWRRSSSRKRKRSSYAWRTEAGQPGSSSVIDGTTTIVCSSCDIDFIDCQSGTSLRWSSSKPTAVPSPAVKASDIIADANGDLAKASPSLNINVASLTS